MTLQSNYFFLVPTIAKCMFYNIVLQHITLFCLLFWVETALLHSILHLLPLFSVRPPLCLLGVFGFPVSP